MAQTLMLSEIQEQPAALRRTLTQTTVQAVVQEAQQREIRLILLAARGTSDHAALYAQYLFQYLNGIPVALATPSLSTLYGTSLRLDHTMVIGISQSGESIDIVEVLAKARAAGALTVAITNQEGSQLAQAVHYSLYCHAGPERSVAATKTYTTTCAILALLAAALPGGTMLQKGLSQLPELVTAALNSEAVLARVSERYVHAQDCIVLGRSFQYCTARETALKLEETCYVIATPFSTADFRHGPSALIERGLPVIIFAPPGRTHSDSFELLRWLRERQADCLVVAEEERLLELATVPVRLQLPPINGSHGKSETASSAELLAPIPYIVTGQLLAHYLALHKGLNPDQPRSLTKITQTR